MRNFQIRAFLRTQQPLYLAIRSERDTVSPTTSYPNRLPRRNVIVLRPARSVITVFQPAFFAIKTAESLQPSCHDSATKIVLPGRFTPTPTVRHHQDDRRKPLRKIAQPASFSPHLPKLLAPTYSPREQDAFQ